MTTTQKRIAFVASAVVIICALGLFLFTKYRDERFERDRAAIGLVFQERQQLREEFLQGGKNRRPVPLGLRKYADAIRAIDTSFCPTPFRKAWLIYTQAWSRQTNETLGDLAYEAGSVVQAVGPAHDAHYFLENSQKLNTREAWFYCERVALEYGVSPTE